MPKIAVIGSGFSGLSAAAYLSAAGHDVHVFEKNNEPGGRARQLKTENGYVFDMGPSWYWMPGVFERFFNDFGKRTSDYYDLTLLDPSFDVVFANERDRRRNVERFAHAGRNATDDDERSHANRKARSLSSAASVSCWRSPCISA